MDVKKVGGESGLEGATRRRFLRTLAGAGMLGFAGCLGGDDDGTQSDASPTGGEIENTPTPTSTDLTGDGTAHVDLRAYPPNHHMDSFTSFSVAFESLVLLDTGGEDVTISVGETTNLAGESPAFGIRVAEDLAVPAGDYEVLEVHYSIDQAVGIDGQTPEIAFTSPGSADILAIQGRPSTIEESSPYVFQAHFGLLSEPWNLLTPTILLGPGIPD